MRKIIYFVIMSFVAVLASCASSKKMLYKEDKEVKKDVNSRLKLLKNKNNIQGFLF